MLYFPYIEVLKFRYIDSFHSPQCFFNLEQYESRGNLAAGKRTADQIILLKDYDPEIIRNFVERVRVYPSGEIEIDMRTSSGFAFVTAS